VLHARTELEHKTLHICGGGTANSGGVAQNISFPHTQQKQTEDENYKKKMMQIF
jgi:hypothetical protein